MLLKVEEIIIVPVPSFLAEKLRAIVYHSLLLPTLR
jgi:hypothetical protein